ncbi:MAG: squalene synthase HpnC [Planctomycetota bacterium]
MGREKNPFVDDLARFGPQSAPGKPLSPRRARKYCRRLASRHYENFTAASWTLPRGLRQHVCNIYAYCRWADDLADETGNPEMSLQLLRWWEHELRACYRHEVRHPVFIALAETIRRFEIPEDPFVDLLAAFRQDQERIRYESIDQVLNYCRYSANPVGRLFLYLGRCHTPERVRLSDSVCTGLQLANFCQDIAIDWSRGRVYLPMVECRRFGYDESMFAARACNEPFRRLMAAQVDEADGFLERGAALVKLMPLELQLPVALFVRGGRAILHAIRRVRYDVWNQRPSVSRAEKLKIFWRSWWQHQRGKLGKEVL